MSIALKKVSCSYLEGTPFAVQAIEEVDLTLDRGDFVGVMGRTGCGKSTLLQLMAGLLSPTSGQVLLEGQNIHDKRFDKMKLRGEVGVVFQHPEYQLFETSVEKDVGFGLRHSGLSSEEISHRVRWAVEIMGFCYDEIRSLSPLALSGGEKRRIAVAGVIAARPAYLLLDEPIAGLDPAAREDFLQLLNTLNREGTAVLMVSHNADSLARCCRRIVVLEKGRIALQRTTEEAFSDPDRMHSLGVNVSRAGMVAHLLRRRGIVVPDSIVREEELIAAILSLKKGDDLP